MDDRARSSRSTGRDDRGIARSVDSLTQSWRTTAPKAISDTCGHGRPHSLLSSRFRRRRTEPTPYSAEDGAGWLAFFWDLTARGLTGASLVTSDAHAGLVTAIGTMLPGAAWQRCRTHYAANLMAVWPKRSWPRVRTLLHSVYD
jgi:hypothetical protein